MENEQNIKSDNTDKNNNKKGNKIAFIVFGLIIVLLIAVVVFLVFKLNNNNNTNVNSNNSNNNANEISQSNNQNVQKETNSQNIEKTSFANLKADDKKFNETQSTIIDYFDNNYFHDIAISDFQTYPQVFKGAKIEVNVIILKVLKSTDNEFEVLAVQGGSLTADGGVYVGYDVDNRSISDWSERSLMVIKGKQLNKRLVKGDVINLFGRFNNVDNYSIDGKDYVLPVTNAINVVQLTSNDKYRFNSDRIKTVAEYIFGKDIKMTTPALGEDYNYESTYTFNPFYKITLDNQSNANFSAFNMYRTYGIIEYNGVSKGTSKKLFITPDFQHYIVSTYDENLKHVYIDYFDKDFNKIWNREFDFASNNSNVIGPLDYNSSQLAIVIDNDLYLINLQNGENIIEPIIVGEKVSLNMMSDGIVLVGNDNKDTIMKVGFDGKILYRTNGNISFTSIETSQIQIINNKLVVKLYGTGQDGFPYEKYLVLNDDGSIETATEDSLGAM